MAETAKKIRRMAGDDPVVDNVIQEQLNTSDVYTALLQLQATVNALVVAFNAHTHATDGNAGDTDPPTAFDGEVAADAELFVEVADLS